MRQFHVPALISAIVAFGLQSAMVSPAYAVKSDDTNVKKAAGQTEAQATAPRSILCKITNITSPVKAGDEATITIATEPNAICKVTVTLKSGPATAAALKNQTADADGNCTWKWKIGKNAAAGEWPVDIQVSSKNLTSKASGKIKITNNQ